MMMIRWWQKWFKSPKTIAEFPGLGRFEFRTGMGWVRLFRLDGYDIEIIIGSNGEMPSTEMIDTVKMWVLEWPILHQKAVEFLLNELIDPVWELDFQPSLGDFIPRSVEVLWVQRPTESMVFFEGPNDDRIWHVSFREDMPVSVAFDH